MKQRAVEDLKRGDVIVFTSQGLYLEQLILETTKVTTGGMYVIVFTGHNVKAHGTTLVNVKK